MSERLQYACDEHGWCDFTLCPKCKARSELPATPCSARVSVRLKASDWETLVNFVQGDISNMDIADPNRTDTEKILNVIRLALAKAPNVVREPSRTHDTQQPET